MSLAAVFTIHTDIMGKIAFAFLRKQRLWLMILLHCQVKHTPLESLISDMWRHDAEAWPTSTEAGIRLVGIVNEVQSSPTLLSHSPRLVLALFSLVSRLKSGESATLSGG